MNVLFVCSSNICRSPYCEFMFRKMIINDDKLSKEDIKVSSSAVFNKSKEIFPKAVVALKKEGFADEEIKSFKSSFKWFDMSRFKEADIIIGMSHMHKMLTPIKYRKKYMTLSEAAIGEYKGIPDPFLYKTQEEYDKVMDVLKDYLKKFFDNFKKEYYEI